MPDSTTPDTVFRNSNPLDFDLYNEDNQQVLYIQDDGSAQRMYLEIHNTSQWEISIPTSGAAAANGDYHFALRFRHGTLRAESQTRFAGMFMNETPILAGQEVTLNISKPLIENDTVSFNISNVGKDSLKLAPGARLKVALDGLGADGRGGARNTRFEVSYQKLNYTGNPASISGGRIHHLSIVNHQGLKNIPLHVSIIGSNTILNDGKTPNLQELRITNVSNASIALGTEGDSASKFILTFDVFSASENNDWALGESGAVGNIVPQAITGMKDQNGNPVQDENWGVTRQNLGESPEWIIQTAKKTSLAPGESVLLQLANIISSMPSGLTNVYVRYENIPGYWDGQFIVSLEKTQLVQRDQFQGDAYSQVSFIGIGTANPSARLEVSGLAKFAEVDVSGPASVAGQFEVGGPLSVTGEVGVGTSAPNSNKLAILQPLGSDDIVNYQHNLQLEIRSGLGSAQSRSMGIGLLNNGKGVLQVKEANVGYNDLLLNPVRGNVGIGTTAPNSRLMIDTGGGADNSIWCEHHGSNFTVHPSSAGGNTTVIENTAGPLAVNPNGSVTMNQLTAGAIGVSGQLSAGTIGVSGQLNAGAVGVAGLLTAGDLRLPSRIVIGDWTIDARQEQGWGQQVSALYISRNGKTIARFGDVVDMFRAYRLSSGSYFYCNDSGNTGWS